MKVKVWDLPTRVFHWTLVSSYIAAYFTSRNERFLEYHTIAGYTALGLTCFRILWGFSGNRYVRFQEFIKGPAAVRSYLAQAARLKPPRYLGHNPAVGWVVVVILIMTLTITVSGIITYGGEEGRGIWAGVFSFSAGMYAGEIHELIAEFAVIVIVVHVSAALFHDFILKENIILSMLTGSKEDEGSWTERVSHMKAGEGLTLPRLVVWIFVAILGGLALLFLRPDGKARVERGFAAEFKPNAVWKAECAESCHSGFHPALLPASSWERLMAGLDGHFGETITLDNAARDEILGWLKAYSAERAATEASKKLLHSIKKGDAPLRITEVPYWKEKHSEVSEEFYRRKAVSSKSNCVACHPGAEAGSFEDKDIRIPQ